eukprot:PhF_6_TR19405/c0_g1_i1/m.28394
MSSPRQALKTGSIPTTNRFLSVPACSQGCACRKPTGKDSQLKAQLIRRATYCDEDGQPRCIACYMNADKGERCLWSRLNSKPRSRDPHVERSHKCTTKKCPAYVVAPDLNGSWYCAQCWEKFFSSGQGERPLCFNSCDRSSVRADPSNGQWYCEECWHLHEQDESFGDEQLPSCNAAEQCPNDECPSLKG